MGAVVAQASMRAFSIVALSVGVGCAADPPPPPARPVALLAPEAGVVRLVGTGAMSPLAARLAEAWSARRREPRIVVEESVGSGGGVRAAADGAVDLGMISRPLHQEERALGLEVVPVARDIVVIAAHPALA